MADVLEEVSTTTQQERNDALLADSLYMKSQVVSRVLPFQIDVDTVEELSEMQVATLQALEIESARIAIESVASLSQLGEVDHLGGGLGMIPLIQMSLALIDFKAKEYTLENAHASIGYYASLAATEFLARDVVVNKFRRGLDIPGHVSWVPGGTQLNGGRLGVMVPVAVGQALGKRARYGKDAWVICLCGDAGWISGQALNGFNAADLHDAPVTFVMDRNGIQLSGSNKQIMDKDPRPIIESLGVTVLEIESTADTEGLYFAYREGHRLAKEEGRPSLIFPTGYTEDESLNSFGEKYGITSEVEALAKANSVAMDTSIWIPGSLMSYRDVEAMIECVFLVNDLPGGKGHHDGHMQGKDLEAVLAGPMLQFDDAQAGALAALREKDRRDVATQARPSPGTSNLMMSNEQVSGVELPTVGDTVSARVGVDKGYALVAESFPEKFFVVSADLDPSTKLGNARKFLADDHQFEMSIEEQAAALVANGLAMSTNDASFSVFSTFAAFFEGIAREGLEMWRYQRNLNGANEGLNVCMHLSHVGACTGRDHFSGWALDWINLGIGYLPYLHRMYAPPDARAAFIAVRDAAANYGGHLVCIPRDNLPILEKQDGSGPLFWPTDDFQAITTYRNYPGAENAILAFGATAFLADEAARRLNDEGIPVDVYVISGFPLEPGKLKGIFEKYPYGLVTIEDGLIGTPETGLRGFAGVVAGAASGTGLDLEHIGITDPSIAPSDGHMEVWKHFGITADALVEAVANLG